MYHALWPALDERDALLRHWAGDTQLQDPGARLYGLDQRVFRRQMLALNKAGAQTRCPWAELAAPGPHRLLITFDDGHQSNFELALPVLEELGLMAIFFITSDWIGRKDFLDEEQILGLRRAGMLIGSHGVTHRYFSDLSADEVRRELADSKARLEGILGESVPGLSLPGGRAHPALRPIAREVGYRHLFTSTPALANSAGDPLAWPRIWPRIPITNLLSDDFVERLARGETAAVRRMARVARLRRLARGLLGNSLYDRLRGRILGG